MQVYKYFESKHFRPKSYLAQTFSNRAYPAACASSELLRACFVSFYENWCTSTHQPRHLLGILLILLLDISPPDSEKEDFSFEPLKYSLFNFLSIDSKVFKCFSTKKKREKGPFNLPLLWALKYFPSHTFCLLFKFWIFLHQTLQRKTLICIYSRLSCRTQIFSSSLNESNIFCKFIRINVQQNLERNFFLIQNAGCAQSFQQDIEKVSIWFWKVSVYLIWYWDWKSLYWGKHLKKTYIWPNYLLWIHFQLSFHPHPRMVRRLEENEYAR